MRMHGRYSHGGRWVRLELWDVLEGFCGGWHGPVSKLEVLPSAIVGKVRLGICSPSIYGPPRLGQAKLMEDLAPPSSDIDDERKRV